MFVPVALCAFTALPVTVALGTHLPLTSALVPLS
jgi:hypothetical protein